MRQDYRGYENSGYDGPYDLWLYEQFRLEMLEEALRDPPIEDEFWISLRRMESEMKADGSRSVT
jgi:hypothetical protein